MRHRYHRVHHGHDDVLYVYLDGKKVLTIKNLFKMAQISINVDDNEADLDLVKQHVAAAAAALSDAISAGQSALAELQAFQISFSVSTDTAATAALAQEPDQAA